MVTVTSSPKPVIVIEKDLSALGAPGTTLAWTVTIESPPTGYLWPISSMSSPEKLWSPAPGATALAV